VARPKNDAPYNGGGLPWVAMILKKGALVRRYYGSLRFSGPSLPIGPRSLPS